MHTDAFCSAIRQSRLVARGVSPLQRQQVIKRAPEEPSFLANDLERSC